MFDRPIHVIHNDSDSIFVDLIECLVGKQYEDLTEPAFVTLVAITKKLLDNKIKKIVIICHSQGTIVVGNVINSLKKMRNICCCKLCNQYGIYFKKRAITLY